MVLDKNHFRDKLEGMWNEKLKDLIRSGMTQNQIADAIGTSQSYISSIYTGARKKISWDFGEKILRLHASRCSELAEQQTQEVT